MSFKLKQDLGNLRSGWKKMGDLSINDMKKLLSSEIGHYLNEKHYNMIAQEYALQTKN